MELKAFSGLANKVTPDVMQTVKVFKGLENITDPLRLGMGWLAIADNVNVTDTGALEKREGYAKSKTGTFSGVYTTIDYQRMYLVDGGTLKTYEGATLATGLQSAPMFWTELNEQVFFSNGTDSGIIMPDNTVLEWRWTVPNAPVVTAVAGSLPAGTYQVRCTRTLPDGRETGPSEPVEITLGEGQALQIVGSGNIYIAPANSTTYLYAGSGTLLWNQSMDYLGRELLSVGLDPLPMNVEVVQMWRGRIYASMFVPSANQSVIWYSEPFAPHLFNLNAGFFMLPGHVRMIAPHGDALIVGTDTRIYAYNSESLAELAPYGVVPGQHWAADGVRILFWSTRGVCAALPFTNLTERFVSVAPGVHAGGTILRHGGQKRYVVALHQGGVAFNDF